VVIIGEILKRPTRADCKSADYVFAGSNPALPTKILNKAVIKRLLLYNRELKICVRGHPNRIIKQSEIILKIKV
tara:strand:- start:292 stop:513 length:222 start_codon:yes stop_codon:yes gene_type:complete